MPNTPATHSRNSVLPYRDLVRVNIKKLREFRKDLLALHRRHATFALNAGL